VLLLLGCVSAILEGEELEGRYYEVAIGLRLLDRKMTDAVCCRERRARGDTIERPRTRGAVHIGMAFWIAGWLALSEEDRTELCMEGGVNGSLITV